MARLPKVCIIGAGSSGIVACKTFAEKGIPFDLSQIKPENLEEVIDQLADLTVDVADRDATVRVFCE